jgi:hypothetical protein
LGGTPGGGKCTSANVNHDVDALLPHPKPNGKRNDKKQLQENKKNEPRKHRTKKIAPHQEHVWRDHLAMQ